MRLNKNTHKYRALLILKNDHLPMCKVQFEEDSIAQPNVTIKTQLRELTING